MLFQSKFIMMQLRQVRRLLGVCVLCMLAAAKVFAQGFLEMPDTTEVPEYERESMLLDLDIPPVRDRDPDPEAGPRLNVKEFRLQGLVEFPKLGITRAELIKRVESIRFDMMKEGALTESGYTLDELGEISDLMADIEKDTEAEHVGPLEVQRLVFLIREQRRRRGVTLGMIETVADTITRFYREKGFILAKAYIPQQKVRDGVVTLTLLLGELGSVRVENNDRTSDRLVQRTFKRDLEQPVTSWKIEESLFLVNDIPGVSAQGFFQPGAQVGDTELVVNVASESRFTSNIRLDNHGSEATGQNRVYADFFLHNPLGIGDELYLSVLNTYDPDDTTYGAIRYDTFVYSPRVRASFGASNNDFVSQNTIAEGGTFFTGESQVFDASLAYFFKRSRVRNLSAEFKVTSISTELTTLGESGSAISTQEDDVLNASLSFNFDILNQRRRQLYLGNLSLVYTDSAPIVGGEGDNVFGERPTEDHYFFTYDVSMLAFWKIPFTNANTRFLVKSAGQYSDRLMPSVNQFSVTGPVRTRGFEVNALQYDDAVYLGADWIFTLPSFGGATLFGESLNSVFQPFLFVDGSYGFLNPQLPGGDGVEGTISNAGLGLKIDAGKFRGSISYAEPTNDDSGFDIDTSIRSVYFDLQYTF